KNEVKATISALNDAFKEVSPSVDRVTELTDELQPIADDLNRSAPDLASVFNQLPELSKRGSTAVNSLSPTLKRGTEVLTSDNTDTLFKRLVRTSGAVKASASVLGLTLGDFRSTGGLDYFMDAIFGLTYATNGRDANGSYLRGAVLNLLSCVQPTRSTSTGCTTQPLSSENNNPPVSDDEGSSSAVKSAVKTKPSGSAPGTDTKAKSTPTGTPSPTSQAQPTSTEQAAADLLLGGTQ
ncbi:MAG: hypothetical protein Q7T55_07740, partial [Solirubrobacteraceae bacterium]|nr:hypothetical protein [Solirubrobacteraceae bacterium]